MSEEVPFGTSIWMFSPARRSVKPIMPLSTLALPTSSSFSAICTASYEAKP